MKQYEAFPIAADLNRRDFIYGGSVAALMTMIAAKELAAQEKSKPAEGEAKKPVGPPLKCGVIGCGVWGRDIINTLLRLPNAQVAAVCDHYEAFLNRAKSIAPDAKGYADFKELLADKNVQAVLIATPTHQHRAIAEAAFKAGKHVYCEAPIAHTPEDGKAIATAAKASPSSNFQSGLLMRSEPQRQFLLPFIRSGAAGKNIKARAQRHKKESWRRAAANPEREKELNWRLDRKISTGLIGEIGIQQIDVLNWFLNTKPLSVTGFGSVVHWADGREVPDSIVAVFEYPGGVLLTYESTLGNSFDADYEMLYGTDAAVMVRQNKAWMFKEADSPLLGWEVYARKDDFYKETGIALVANATKLAALGEKPAEEVPFTNTPLFHALDAFLYNSRLIGGAVEDFVANFGDGDAAALRAYLVDFAKNKMPAAGWQEGYESLVTVLKANEAILSGKKLAFTKELFEV